MGTRRHHRVGDSNRQRSLYCNEDGRKDREGEEVGDAIPSVADLQCAWQILLQSANPRANHSIRILPPTLSAAYRDAHDAGIWAIARALLGGVRIAVSSTLCASCFLGLVWLIFSGDDPRPNPRRPSWWSRWTASWWRLSWTELRESKRPPQHDARDPGEWPRGWQYWASSITGSRC